MTLRACIRCGGTLTEVFRFCPACGHSNDDPGWPGEDPGWAKDESGWPDDDPGWTLEAKSPVSFPIVEPRRRPLREPRRRSWKPAGRVPTERLTSLVPAAGRRWDRFAASARPFLQRLNARARLLLAASGEAASLLAQVAVLSAGSIRDALRSMVLMRRLQAQRAAVIYSAGWAALSGDDRQVEHGRAELRMLDDLITVATGQNAAAAVPADVPTQEALPR